MCDVTVTRWLPVRCYGYVNLLIVVPFHFLLILFLLTGFHLIPLLYTPTLILVCVFFLLYPAQPPKVSTKRHNIPNTPFGFIYKTTSQFSNSMKVKPTTPSVQFIRHTCNLSLTINMVNKIWIICYKSYVIENFFSICHSFDDINSYFADESLSCFSLIKHLQCDASFSMVACNIYINEHHLTSVLRSKLRVP